MSPFVLSLFHFFLLTTYLESRMLMRMFNISRSVSRVGRVTVWTHTSFLSSPKSSLSIQPLIRGYITQSDKKFTSLSFFFYLPHWPKARKAKNSHNIYLFIWFFCGNGHLTGDQHKEKFPDWRSNYQHRPRLMITSHSPIYSVKASQRPLNCSASSHKSRKCFPRVWT